MFSNWPKVSLELINLGLQIPSLMLHSMLTRFLLPSLFQQMQLFNASVRQQIKAAGLRGLVGHDASLQGYKLQAACSTKTPCYVSAACDSSVAHAHSGKWHIAPISSDTCEHSPPAAEKQTDRTRATFSLAMQGASAVLHWETALCRQSFPICVMYSTIPTEETTAINTSG